MSVLYSQIYISQSCKRKFSWVFFSADVWLVVVGKAQVLLKTLTMAKCHSESAWTLPGPWSSYMESSHSLFYSWCLCCSCCDMSKCMLWKNAYFIIWTLFGFNTAFCGFTWLHFKFYYPWHSMCPLEREFPCQFHTVLLHRPSFWLLWLVDVDWYNKPLTVLVLGHYHCWAVLLTQLFSHSHSCVLW